MKALVCIAQYGEDVSWTKVLRRHGCTVVIYDKQRMVNVGREQETFLRFIIQYYNAIKKYDRVLFLQANPFDHVDIQCVVESLTSKSPVTCLGRLIACDSFGQRCHPGLPVREKWRQLAVPGGEPNKMRWLFSAGSQYAVDPALLLHFPRYWWRWWHELVYSEKMCAWTSERLWLEVLVVAIKARRAKQRAGNAVDVQVGRVNSNNFKRRNHAVAS